MSQPNYALGIGLRPYVLPHLRQMVGEGTLPQTKIENVGFWNYLNTQKKASPGKEFITLNTANGHRQAVQVKYLQRVTKDFTGTNEADVCNVTNENPYNETTVTLDAFRFYSYHIDDELIAQYEQDASSFISAGTPPTQLMNEFIEQLMTAANGIIDGMNQDLLSIWSTKIGVNRTTGLNTAKAINLPKDITKLPLNDGLTEIQSDAVINLFGNKTSFDVIGGSTLFLQFMLQQRAKGLALNGMNTAIQAANFMYHYDQAMQNTFAAQDIVVCDRNAVQLTEYLQFTGSKAGWKPGASLFGTIELPYQLGTEVIPCSFDYQLRYSDCVQTITDQYYGTPITLQRGYTMILSKKAGLFTVPTDAYRGTDPMKGNNGTLRYNVSNNCDVC